MATLGVDMPYALRVWLVTASVAFGLVLAGCGTDGGGSPAGGGPEADQGPAGDHDLGPADVGPAAADAAQPDAARRLDQGPDPTDLGPQPRDAADEADLGGPPTCTVQGRVLSPDGPVQELSLVLCDDVFCNRARSEATGHFVFEQAPNKPLALKVLGGALGLSSMTIGDLLCTAEVVDLGDIRVWPLPAGVMVAADSGVEAHAHADLSLTVGAGLEYPNFEAEAEVTALRLQPEDLHPRLRDALAPDVVFALAPYGTGCPTPAGFAARSGLDAGTTVTAYALDHSTGAAIELFSVAAEADGWIRSPEGQGLPKLSWLILQAAR